MIALAVDLLLGQPAWGRATGFRIDRFGFARDPLPAAKESLMPDVDPLVRAKR
jgi:hypothetical protein